MADKFSRSLHLHKGALTRHGYSVEESERYRHEALERAARQDGYATTERRLNVIGNLDEHESPHIHRVIEEDKRWLERTYGRNR
jgi:Family of unknown function (DUF5771)